MKQKTSCTSTQQHWLGPVELAARTPTSPACVAECAAVWAKKNRPRKAGFCWGGLRLLSGRGGGSSSGDGGVGSGLGSIGCGVFGRIHGSGRSGSASFHSGGSSVGSRRSGSLGSRCGSFSSRRFSGSGRSWGFHRCWSRSGLGRSGYWCGSGRWCGLFFFAASGQCSSSDHGSQDEGLVHCRFPKVGGTNSRNAKTSAYVRVAAGLAKLRCSTTRTQPGIIKNLSILGFTRK